MSNHGFHVHGPHDHQLEHAAQGEAGSFAGHLPVVTAILATVGALFSFMSGATETEAMGLDNDAAIRRTEATVQWAAYLGANGKHNLAGPALKLSTEANKPALLADLQQQEAEMATRKRKAEDLDAEAIRLDKESDELLRRHHRWSQATTVL